MLYCAFGCDHPCNPLGQTCKDLDILTRDRSIWLSLYQAQSQTLPVPYPLDWISSPETSTEVTTSQVESLVVSLYCSNHRWNTSSGPPRRLYFPPTDPDLYDAGEIGLLLLIEVFLGRWVVAIYQEGVALLWDLFPTSRTKRHDLGFKWNGQRVPLAPLRRTRHELQGIGMCNSAALALSKEQDAIVIAVAR